jgi:hypothetical protein
MRHARTAFAVTGPATLEDARTGDRTIVPAGETWTSNG